MQLLGFPDLVQRFATAARASTSTALNFTVGSVFRAAAEASAAVGLWMQWLIIIVLRQTRASTSIGTELDTFVADFGMTRLPASAASGLATFSRNAATLAAFIPVGATALTTDRTQGFIVVADATNPLWTGTGFLVPAGVASATLAMVAIVGGAAGNVQAGTITVPTSAIPGIDTITNAAPFASGLDAESDAALRVRFRLFIDSRSRGTASAFAYAIASLRQGLTYTLIENTATDGSYRPGFTTVLIDDGSGAPSSALLLQVAAAIEPIRALGCPFAVVAPAVLTATVSMILATATGYNHQTVVAQVQAAILAYVDALPIGAPLPYFALGQLALNTPGVTNLSALTVNGGAADIGGGPTQVVKATVSSVSVS